MALTSSASSFCTTFNNWELRLLLTSSRKCLPCSRSVRVPTIAATKVSEETITRRSANYCPSNWDYNFIESLTSKYVGEPYTTRIEELKGEVKRMLEREENHLDQLEMIDTLQRLGVAYHFEDEIERALNAVYHNNSNNNCNNKIIDEENSHSLLYATALQFRLLRQHGYIVKQDVFNVFKDERGKFKAYLGDNLKGLVFLYEASYLLVEGEEILEEAKDFAQKNLQSMVQENNDRYWSMMARHALELPLHWRMLRGEARWFINAYRYGPFLHPVFLDLAKLDFNMVQSIHQQDLKHVTSWWKKMGLGEELKFVRARPMEGFLWTVGGVFEPQFGYTRKILSRMGALVTVVDDIYDVYGTLDELQLFTDAVVRWDINAMGQLPQYMKICFLALYNTVNEMAYDILKDQGLDVIAYLKKGWADLCQSYFLEAKWYRSGYIPSVKEYLENAWISISAPLLLIHAYFTATNQITEEASECLKHYPDIVRYSSLITRLADDLGTSSHEAKRGDNPKAIECYMHENGASEEEAREHVRCLISEAWKKINEHQIQNNNVFSETFMRMAMNLARTSQCIYQYGDGFGAQNLETKNHVVSLLIHPLPLPHHLECSSNYILVNSTLPYQG